MYLRDLQAQTTEPDQPYFREHVATSDGTHSGRRSRPAGASSRSSRKRTIWRPTTSAGMRTSSSATPQEQRHLPRVAHVADLPAPQGRHADLRDAGARLRRLRKPRTAPTRPRCRSTRAPHRAQSSPRLTMGTPDANGQPAKGVASLKTIVSIGQPLHARGRRRRAVHDLGHRRAQDLRPLRLHRRARGAHPAAGSPTSPTPPTGRPGSRHRADFDLHLDVPCSATGDPNIGSTATSSRPPTPCCPARRSRAAARIWQTDQIEVPATPPVQPFLRQGVFVP